MSEIATINNNKKKDILYIAIVLIVSFAAYYNSLFNSFTYDDKFIITQNFEFQNIHKINSLFNNSYFAYSQELSYRPLVTISHLIDYVIWGLKPFGHHLTNLFLHIIATLLFYVLVKQIFQTSIVSLNGRNLKKWDFDQQQIVGAGFPSSVLKGDETSPLQDESNLLTKNNMNLQNISFFSALLFGVLTIHTETVCSIGLRADVLMAIFFFLSIIFVIIYFQKEHFVLKMVQDIYPEPSNNKVINNSKIEQQKSPRIYYFFVILSALMYFLALLSKETALIFLPFITIFHLLILRVKLKEYIIVYIPHLLITIFYLIIRFILIRNPMELELMDFHTQIQVVLLMPYIIVKYILFTLLPIDMSVNYFINLQDKLLLYKVIIAYVIFTLLIVISFSLIKKERLLSFCIFSFFCLLLPVANLLPIANPMAERYLYLPSLSFCILITYICITRFKRIEFIILVFLIVLNSVLIYNRAKIWKNDFTLWTSEIKKMEAMNLGPTGNQLWDRIIARPYANLGIYYLENNELTLANTYLEIAHYFNKNSVKIVSSLAISKAKSGNKTEAIYLLTDMNVEKLSPAKKVTIGDAFYDINDFEKALEIYNQSFSQTKNITYKIKMAKALISLGQSKISPVGNAYMRSFPDKSLIQRGKEICEEVLKSDEFNVEAIITLATALYHLEDYQKAKEISLSALKINKNISHLYFLLASIEEKLNNMEEAEKSYISAIKLKPSEVDSYINLGVLYASQGKYDKAKEWWERGLLIEKNNEIIEENLKRLAQKTN